MSKVKKYYTVKHHIIQKTNLHVVAQKVISNNGSAGVDDETVDEFQNNYRQNMQEIHRQLVQDRYEPSPVLRTYIPKDSGGKRPLGIPTLKDRIVQAAVKRTLEEIFEPIFCDCSYGFRPERSTHDAIAKVEEYRDEGYKWLVDADIKSYFDNVNHDLLIKFMTERITDGWVLDMVRSWLTAGVMTDSKGWIATSKGTPQGGVISPLLANIYLHQFDRIMVNRGYKIVRFADDFVVLTKSKRKAERALEVIKEIIEGKLKLKLNEEKTKITNFGDGFTFLGYEFHTWRYKRPRKRAIKKFKNKVRYITKRQQPWPVKSIIEDLNPVIRGWGYYFGKGNVKTLFTKLMQWIRMRLRCYIEKKKATKNQNERIPNAYLRQKGLVSLLTTLS